MQCAADFARIDVEPVADTDVIGRQQSLPGSGLDPGSGHDHLGALIQKPLTEIVHFARTKGIGGVFIHGASGAFRVIAPEEEPPGQPGEMHIGSRHPQPEVIVFRPAVVTIPPQLFQYAPAAHDPGMHERGFDKQVFADQSVVLQRILPGFVIHHPLLQRCPGEMFETAGHEPGIRVRPKVSNLFRQATRVTDIISVHAGQQRGAAQFKPGIQRCHQAATIAPDHFYPAVTCGSRGKNPGGAVAGTVINRHQFPIVKGLAIE